MLLNHVADDLCFESGFAPSLDPNPDCLPGRGSDPNPNPDHTLHSSTSRTERFGLLCGPEQTTMKGRGPCVLGLVQPKLWLYQAS